MEITGTLGKMRRNGCSCGYGCWNRHGKENTENEISKKKRRRGSCTDHLSRKFRWNKKAGELEFSKKGSKILRWCY
jgi:hypothetical protein